MKISKTHQEFSDYLRQPDALTDPEKYLGPNWEDVLNFWIYLDTLSELEREEISDGYWSLVDKFKGVTSWEYSTEAAEEVVGREFRNAAWDAVYYTTEWYVFGYATWELIGSHKLLEQNQTPTFLPLCIKS